MEAEYGSNAGLSSRPRLNTCFPYEGLISYFDSLILLRGIHQLGELYKEFGLEEE
jgi:hypothetical protein